MVIDIARMAPSGARFEGEDPASILGIADDTLRAEQPVGYRLAARLVGLDLIVHGVLRTVVSVKCSRCSVFSPKEVVDDGFEIVREVSETEEYVDLTEDMRESIILAFPSYPVCSSACRGLCVQCGANLNEGHCGCKPPEDGRWSALEALDL
jgi:uncharacterized protein